MTLTREKLRAARALLSLRQDQLATLADVGIATECRCEGGKEVGQSQLDALRAALEGAEATTLSAKEALGRARTRREAIRPAADRPGGG